MTESLYPPGRASVDRAADRVIVWCMGMPPLEQTWPKACNARQVNADLTEYDVPANADIGIDIRFVPEDDSHLNPLGVKSIGDSGIAGVAASIANAVHHATGKRVRSLPIALDKLL